MATKRALVLPADPRESRSYWQTAIAPLATGQPALPATADIAVIGGGLLGVSTAYWLARAGASVVLLEAHTLAAGATGHNGGFMVAGTAESYPQAIERHGHAAAHAVWSLTLESRALLRQTLAEEAIDCDYREPGLLHLALGAEQHARLAQTVAALHADGFAAELLDRDQAQGLIGTALGPKISGGLFAPEDGLLHPARLVLGLADAARRHGARIYEGAPVLHIESGGVGLRLQTARGDMQACAAVVAVNAWSDQLIPALRGVITPVRGQVLAYAPMPPLFRCGMGAAITPTGEYWQQALDGTIVLGGCRAVAPGGDVGVYAAEPTPEVQAALEDVLPQLFPALRGEDGGVAAQVERRWTGLMAFTADRLPIADRAPGLAGAWVVGGFSGHGMPFGLRLGQLLAEAATGDTAPAGLAPLRLGRPTLG